MRLSRVLFVFYIFRYVSVLQRLKRRRHLKIRAAALCNFSVLKIYLLVFCGRIAYQSGRIEIFAMHINSRNLMIVIRCVIVNSLICIATRCVKRNLVFAAFQLAATPWLAYRIENMEKLTYAFSSPSSDKEFALTNAALTNLDCEERSPGSPSAPIPRE